MANDYTPVTIIRGNSTVIDSTSIVDGQILFDETRKCLFMDNGSTREKYSGLGADSNIANVEDTTTASQPYTTGEFVVVEGQLYKVTASIATGDTFSVGTNVETDTIGSEITQINTDLSALRSHVGMIIHSTTLDTEAKVKAIYGGTSWSKIEGRFLLGASSSHAVNSTGGSETVTLTVQQIPSHTHTYAASYQNTGLYSNNTSSGPLGWSNSKVSGSTGGGQAHDNMPPFKTVYIWERIA